MGTFCSPPGCEGHQGLCSVCVPGGVPAVSLCSALSPVHGSHEPASAAGSCRHTRWPPCCTQGPHTGNAAALQNVLSRSAAGYLSLRQTEEGDGFLTGMLGFPRTAPLGWPLQQPPSGPCRQSVPPGAASTPQRRLLCSPASTVLYPSTDIPCQRPRGHCRGLQAWADEPGATAQPHCPELGGLLAAGTPPAPSTISTERGRENPPNKA